MSAHRTIRIGATVVIHFVVLSALCSPALPDSTVTSAYDRPASEDEKCKCLFPKHFGKTAEAAMNRLKPLCDHRYSVDDGRKDGYTYDVGICKPVSDSTVSALSTAGVIQTTKNKPEEQRNAGSIEQAELMTGSSWMILEYEGGGPFNQHCQRESRRSVIMILCKPGEKIGKLRWVEENSNKSADCYYLFELDHEAACSDETDDSLSIGSVICIVFFTAVGAYLMLGFLYMRCLRGAKGMNQIPNYGFWRDFGALQSDGCNLVCRCGNQRPESKYYHGIGDHQIESANDVEERDDHLLPM